MAGHLITYLTRQYFDGSPAQTVNGSGYRIGDNYVLTAAHVFFDWNLDDTSPVIGDIWAASSNFLDYRGYRSQYLSQVQQEITQGGPYPNNPVIEGRLGNSDSIVFKDSGSLGSDGDGLVTFLNRFDLENVASVLGSGAKIFRQASVTGINQGSVDSTSFNGTFVFSNNSVLGDSGGAYLLTYDGRDYVVGTHAGNTLSGAKAVGTFFGYGEWQQINDLLEAGHSGNVTGNEPTNLVVGTGGNETIFGSFRPDIILGMAGDDLIFDGDSAGDTVWADDTLVGGSGDDHFVPGRGDDTIWGGDEDDDAPGGGGHDIVNYAASPTPISLAFEATAATSKLTIEDAHGDTDTLHSIEQILGSPHDDKFSFKGIIPNGYNLIIYSGGGDTKQDILDLNDAATGMTVANTDDGGILTSQGSSGRIELVGFHTDIVGSAYDDTITDDASGPKKIKGGGGDDVISVSVGAALIDGGEGDDELNGGAGNDTLVGGAGTNVLNGGGGGDLLIGSSQGDVLDGGAGKTRAYASRRGRARFRAAGAPSMPPAWARARERGTLDTQSIRSGKHVAPAKKYILC